MPTDRRLFLGSAGAAAVALALFAPRTGNAAPQRYPLTLPDGEWRRRLGPQRYDVLRNAGTERPFTSPLLNEHRRGTFQCAGCAQPLFSSGDKFDSGTGWPSFTRPFKGAVAYRRDRTLGMVRTEEHCTRCGGHLGHVFDDGPPPTGKRHCINGLALRFRPA